MENITNFITSRGIQYVLSGFYSGTCDSVQSLMKSTSAWDLMVVRGTYFKPCGPSSIAHRG
ncbi:hypothetical protein T12_6250 [Trichinella patagoniensis]|uniref:Uncharacterized protein n=1 Tax=Trichinella patagoniensis TaxID=990121 RepID=A0A0V0XTV4_9BILA|nr:hypothetical protein T12_6250 [Trichinella patagoniensis]